MQETLIAEATVLSSRLTLPELSSDIVNSIIDSTKKVETTAAGFVPFLHNTAMAPANNGIMLTLNVTEVSLKSASIDSVRLVVGSLHAYDPSGSGVELQGILRVTAQPSPAVLDTSGKQELKVLQSAAGEEWGLCWCDP